MVLCIASGGTWHPVLRPGHPLPSTQISQEVADNIGRASWKARQVQKEGVEQVRAGSFAASAPLKAILEVKGEVQEVKAEGHTVSFRSVAAEAREFIKDSEKARELVELGTRNIKKGNEGLRFVRHGPKKQ